MKSLCALLLIFSVCVANTIHVSATAQQTAHNAYIERFQEYLRIKSVQPKPDYASATKFLIKQAERIGLKYHVLEPVSGKPIVVIEWTPTKPTNEKGVMLNSHTDVVPVDLDKWNHDPFAANYDSASGNIYARGSQDMKCVGLQYLEAIERLKSQNVEPKRPIYVTFVPDEEVGGKDGMGELVNSELFKKMNIAFGLDEGLSSETDVYKVYNGERCAMWFYIEATGNVGHGSAFINNTSTEKIAKIIQKVFEFRASQEREMQLRGKKSGEVVSINLTSMKGGHTKDCGDTFSMNIIPSTAQIGLDVRVPPQIHWKKVEEMILQWAPPQEGYKLRYFQEGYENPLSEFTGKYAKVFLNTLQEKLKLKTEFLIFPAATDARFLRQNNIPVIGFSPIINHPILLHDHNEYLNDKTYLQGIEIYAQIIKDLATSEIQE